MLQMSVAGEADQGLQCGAQGGIWQARSNGDGPLAYSGLLLDKRLRVGPPRAIV
jgi:hypothetical protein